MKSRRILVAAGAAIALTVAGATVVSAAGESVPVGCEITDNVLSCPLPEPAAPVTVTSTVTPDPVTTTATVTVTQPPVTSTVTVTAASASSTPTSSTPTSSTPASSTTTTPPPATGWPDASNTGVPAGTTLTAYTGPSTITVAGTVIDSKKITSCIVIKANNVVIRKSLLQTNGCFFNVLSDNGNTGLQLTDVTIDGQGNATGDSAVNGSGYTCLRCNIFGTVDGFKAGSNVVIQDSWIHDLVIQGDSHNDGIQSLGTTSLKILHNNIVLKDGATSAVILSTGSASSMKNIQIDGNLLGGGAFTVYGGYAAGVDVRSRVSNIVISNNKFTTAIFPRSGAYGPLTSSDSPVVVTGNTWLDGPRAGQTVS